MATMKRLKKCCCCSLKYGFLGFGVLTLLFRICSIFVLVGGQQMLLTSAAKSNDTYAVDYVALPLSGIATFLGWFVGTSVVLFVALIGIVQKRTVLIFPYIVVLVAELIMLVVSSLVTTIVFAFLPFLVQIPLAGIINGYSIWCLISLFAEIKEHEKRSSQISESSLRDVPYETV